jgi:hypothetical protein
MGWNLEVPGPQWSGLKCYRRIWVVKIIDPAGADARAPVAEFLRRLGRGQV